jgi:hypothetical protein
MKKSRWVLVALVTLALAGVVVAQQVDFKARWQALSKDPNKIFKVTAKPGEEIPEATLNLSFGPGSLISVSRGGSDLPKDMLGDDDIAGVVNRNLRTVKFCYCKALKADPEFAGDAIIGMQIKTTGNVAKVEIQPEDIQEHQFGKCLAPQVAKWQFPKFSGKKEDGLQVKSVGYEFPLSFNKAE